MTLFHAISIAVTSRAAGGFPIGFGIKLTTN